MLQASCEFAVKGEHLSAEGDAIRQLRKPYASPLEVTVDSRWPVYPELRQERKDKRVEVTCNPRMARIRMHLAWLSMQVTVHCLR